MKTGSLMPCFNCTKSKIITLITVLLIKKEKDPLSFRRIGYLSLEDKIIKSIVITMGITIITFFGLILFTLIKLNYNFLPNIDLDFNFLLATGQIILFTLLVVFSLNGFTNNMKFMPVKLKKIIWNIGNLEYLRLTEAVLNLEAKQGRISVSSIVWRLTLSLYIVYTIFLGRLLINFFIKIILFVVFTITLPIFILKEITHKSLILLAIVSLTLSGLFLTYLEIDSTLISFLGLCIFITGLVINITIKTNLYTYFTKKLYNKFKFPIYIN